MTFIKSKYNFIALFSLLFLLIYIVPVQAEPKNVLDCIENEEECEEQADELVDINESNNNELIENESFQSTSLVFNIVKMIVALFFVLALIYAILLILRKRNKLLQHHDLLENLGGISLGQNKSLQLIRIGSHIYVVGVGEHVDLMIEITEPEVLEALLNNETEEEKESIFKNLLSPNQKSKSDNGHFIDQLKNELSKLQNNRKKLVHKTVEKDDEHV